MKRDDLPLRNDETMNDQAVMRFKKSDRADVLVATDVAAKGL